MNVIRINPQGYCYGVVRAINIAKQAAKTQNQPIYILGDIVHNKLVSESLSNLNIITVESKGALRTELLDQINSGTVIFTAHGVSPKVRELAKKKNLNMIDATCPEVMKTQDEIKKYLDLGYNIIFVGKENHPEAEACTNIDYDRTTFISKLDDIDKYNFNDQKYFITYQSTLNTEDTSEISLKLEERLKDKIFYNKKSICDATYARQTAIKNLKDVDFLIVVGDEHSNNSNKLVEISNDIAKVKAKRIMSASEIDLTEFKNYETIAITSGASTPTQLTNHIIKFFENFDYYNKSTWNYQEFDIKSML